MQNIHEPAAPRHPLASAGYALPQQEQATQGEPSELFDWALIGSYATFVFHSIWRHKLQFLLVWGGIIGLSAGLMFVLPKTYQVKTTLQAQRNQVMASLSNPGRAVPIDADAPTRLAAETVHRYDNLLALIQQTELIKDWPLHRAPILKLKDFIWRHVFKPPTQQEQTENFVYYLQNRLWVVTGDGTVTIGIEFPDPQLAYRLVDTALQNFLEARHAADVSSIAEAITLLEGRAEQAHLALATSLQQLQAAREARTPRAGNRVSRSSVESRASTPLDQEATRLLVAIQSKRRAIADLEEFRRRRIIELQTGCRSSGPPTRPATPPCSTPSRAWRPCGTNRRSWRCSGVSWTRWRQISRRRASPTRPRGRWVGRRQWCSRRSTSARSIRARTRIRRLDTCGTKCASLSLPTPRSSTASRAHASSSTPLALLSSTATRSSPRCGGRAGPSSRRSPWCWRRA